MTFTHVENGYFRRLSNYCSDITKMNREEFSQLASESWQKNLNMIGFKPGEMVKQLYHDYLLQGGKLMVDLSPLKPFTLGSTESLLDKNLISYFGISASLNGVSANVSELVVDGAHFRPAPVTKAAVKERTLDETSKKKFHQIPLNELDQSLKKQVRIHMLDGKQYLGEVVLLGTKSLELSQILEGGSVSYSLQLSQIESLEVWR